MYLYHYYFLYILKNRKIIHTDLPILFRIFSTSRYTQLVIPGYMQLSGCDSCTLTAELQRTTQSTGRTYNLKIQIKSRSFSVNVSICRWVAAPHGDVVVGQVVSKWWAIGEQIVNRSCTVKEQGVGSVLSRFWAGGKHVVKTWRPSSEQMLSMCWADAEYLAHC